MSVHKKSCFEYLKTLVTRQRLGQLLVLSGLITPEKLRDVLQAQKEKNLPLGQILIEQGVISKWQLSLTLWKQHALRLCAGFILMFATFGGASDAQAEMINDVPAKISLTSAANNAFAPIKAHPAVFESDERKSDDLRAFTKWTDMFDRFDQELQAGKGQRELNLWREQLADFDGSSISEMAEFVNDLVNEIDYVNDSRIWGKSDYWATPIEFITRGAGDCEDFAIAKYAALRAMGVPEERLRVAIVHDEVKDIPHAILIVYTESGPVILDNQVKNVIDGDRAGRYRPIYSINRSGWWLHTQPEATRIAAAY